MLQNGVVDADLPVLRRRSGPVRPRERGRRLMRVAVIGGNGKTGRAVRDALTRRGAVPVTVGRAEWPTLSLALADCEATYLIAPNMHPDEPRYVADALVALRQAGVPRVVYHSVASPYAPQMPHHIGKAESEDLVRRSGLAWTILQPGAYLQNLDLTGDLEVPYDVDDLWLRRPGRGRRSRRGRADRGGPCRRDVRTCLAGGDHG